MSSPATKLPVKGNSHDEYSCASPVLFIVFNRPDTTLITLEAISKAKPRKLYVACDGPRPDRPDDFVNVNMVKEIVQNLSWECEVSYKFNETNLGVGRAPAEAISWFFDLEEDGIVLEDDCIASQSFFVFCESMLKKYKNDDRIMSVAGTNICKNVKYDSDYVYTNFPLMWGWATWRRAWKMHDTKMLDWPDVKARGSFSRLDKDRWKFHPVHVEFFTKTYESLTPNWDHQWIFAHWNKSGLAVISSKNLVSNVGFDEAASHFSTDHLGRGNLTCHHHMPPYSAPAVLEEHAATDKYISKNWFSATYFYYLKISLLRVKLIKFGWNVIKPVYKKFKR